MEKVKIIINGQKRSFVIPLEYDEENGTLNCKEFQVDAMPKEGDDLSNDIVISLAELITNALTKKDEE